MAHELVLSIFPGLDMLGMGFEAEGYCVVRGLDVLWGGDVRDFHPPSGVFDGVIGGDPCQSHSALANLVRAKGLEPSFPDMTDEYMRIVAEAEPAWFLRENVPHAPEIYVEGYGVHSFVIDNASLLDQDTGLGLEQSRKRRIWFGIRDSLGCDLRKHIDFACFELPEPALSVTGGHGQTLGNRTTAARQARSKAKCPSVTGAHTCSHRPRGGHGERYTLAEMLHLQGLPADCLDRAPFTMEAKRKLVGNGVPIPMARALARAIKEAL